MILYNNWAVTFGKFPNGESYLKNMEIDSRDINHIVTLKYESDEDIFHLMLLREALKPLSVSLRILYVPYSRMDRESTAYTFSLKIFTDLINSMNWEKVIIYEPHSDVTPALLDRVKVVKIIPKLIDVVTITDYQVFYPDAGAQKRYGEDKSFTKWRAEHPLVGFKNRDFETGQIKSLDILGEKLSDNVVIVDDLCSKGGTFILAARTLKDMGFSKIILVVAHCENTILEGEVLTSGLIDRVITTDSILSTKPVGVDVIPMRYFKG